MQLEIGDALCPGCGHYSIKGNWVYCDPRGVERRRADAGCPASSFSGLRCFMASWPSWDVAVCQQSMAAQRMASSTRRWTSRSSTPTTGHLACLSWTVSASELSAQDGKEKWTNVEGSVWLILGAVRECRHAQGSKLRGNTHRQKWQGRRGRRGRPHKTRTAAHGEQAYRASEFREYYIDYLGEAERSVSSTCAQGRERTLAEGSLCTV